MQSYLSSCRESRPITKVLLRYGVC